ncbi:putative N-hydroxyarylamine O-acetyltransferase [Penicillium brasilianum]|uniref:Putative N-hydroxyarylamine O-acetyltransferase n=1 Tax=Penicillium brasilianum TaxID=104259 RepID=A0A1S9RDT1_PENBI|nr:putative N-hydroxyarylamine O-acetyltransferase [Penicillium brasilianum]
MASAFSPAQLSKYLKHLALPPEYDQYIDNPHSFPKTEDALTTLFRGQITRFPYDNLSVHYSNTDVIDIRPESIYPKFMGPADCQPSRRGGYCLECSIFFYHVLLGFGFSTYTTGVRNRARIDGVPQGEYRGWYGYLQESAAGKHTNLRPRTHIVNIVQLPSGEQYHVDAAFGGDGPTRPLRLISGQPVHNLGTQEVQLVYGNIPKQTRSEQKLWIYQYRNGPSKAWNSFYSFAELEFYQDDFEVINRYTSWEARDRGNFWIVKFLRGGEVDGLPLIDGEGTFDDTEAVPIVGKLMYVNGVVKLNMGGKTRVIDSYQSEEERFAGLKKWFGMTFE